MARRLLISASLVCASAVVAGGQTARLAPAAAFRIIEATIPQMRDAMAAKRLTSRQLVTQYLTRIGLYENRLHAAIVVNPHALELADERDREQAQGRIRGPLHGIPIALKDLIDTADVRTTSASALHRDRIPTQDAEVVRVRPAITERARAHAQGER